MRIAVLVGTSLLLCAGAQAQDRRSVGSLIAGSVSSVASGDTFRIGFDRIRLWGINAPDSRARCMVGGRKWRPELDSVEALRECVRGTAVTCRIQKIEP